MKKVVVLITFTLMISCIEHDKTKDHLNLESKLSGKWIAMAFDGELHEEWVLNPNGWMQQEAYYIENNDTSYAAKTQIQKVGKEIILLSVIKDANPKIFKSIIFKENTIVFENDDYKNPFQVKYEFLTNKKYNRTIKGHENDSLVSYEFNFVKQN